MHLISVANQLGDMYSSLKGTQGHSTFEMQGGGGGRIINIDICTPQSMQVVLLNQYNIDSLVVFFPKKESMYETHLKEKAA